MPVKTINRDKLGRRREEAKAEAKGYKQTLKFQKEGFYLLFLCPPCDPDDEDGFPFAEIKIHYGVGASGRPAACLRTEKNPILLDSRSMGHVKGAPGCYGSGCQVCDFGDDVDDPKAKKDFVAKPQYAFNLVLMGTKEKKAEPWKMISDPKVEISLVGPQIWEGITDQLLENPEIVDPSAAVFLVLQRTGLKQFDTEYKVTLDRETDRNPVALSKGLRRQIEEQVRLGGENDLFKYVAENFIHSQKTVEKLLSTEESEKVEEEEDSEDRSPASTKKPSCFGLDYLNDDECKGCSWRYLCSQKLGKKLFPGHDLKEGEHGYAEWAKSKTPPPADEEEEEEEAPRKRRAAKTTPPPPDEEEEEEDDLEEEEEEEEGDPGDDDIDIGLSDLGYTAEQIGRFSRETAGDIYKRKIPSFAVSVLKSGGVKVFPEKLPKEHPEYKAPAPAPAPESEGAEKPKRRKKTEAAVDSESPPAEPKKRGRPPGSKKKEEPPKDEEETETEGGDEIEDTPDDSDNSLDALERELARSSKKKS